MAHITTKDNERRITCDRPACCRGRHDRGQRDGRFLASVTGGDSLMPSLTVVCPECGGTHTVPLAMLVEGWNLVTGGIEPAKL